MNNTIILKYVLLTWGISGVIISLVTWLIMLKREGFKITEIDWSNIIDVLHGIFIVSVLSYTWVVLIIYWHYEDKKRLKKIKEGKTSSKDLF